MRTISKNLFFRETMNLTDDEIRQATCAVIIDGDVIGTAWLVSDEGYLLTAGHLLIKKEECVLDQVTICFSDDVPRPAFKRQLVYMPVAGLDFAVLQLNQSVDRVPLDIKLNERVEGELRLYGYGESLQGLSKGVGKFLDRVHPQENPSNCLFKFTSNQLGEGGFSGGAVVSDELQAAVALQISATSQEQGAEEYTVLAMPLYRVARNWDKLVDIVKSKKLPFTFNPNLFVNREKEREWFNNILEEQRLDIQLVEYIGVSGQGKTLLLRQFFYSATGRQKCLVGYIDLQRDRLSRKDVCPILEEIVRHLCRNKEAKAFFHKFNKQLKAYNQHKKSDEEEEVLFDNQIELLEDFTICLKSLPSFYKVVLCFDNTECVDPAVIQHLAGYLFEPLLNQENFLLVFAGQQEIDWENRKVRRQVKQKQLTPLTTEDIDALIDRLLPQDKLPVRNKGRLLEKICQLTLGHPLSSYNVLDVLSEGFSVSLPDEITEKYYRRSVKELVERVIKKRILQNLELSSDYPSPEEILFYLAPLRRIEFSTIHFVLSTFLPDSFPKKPYDLFEKLITEFQTQTYIFTPWTLGAGFDLEEVTRNILLSDLRINHNEKFIEIQRALIDQYDQWIERTSDASQVKNIVERLYHAALLMIEEKVENITEIIVKKLKEYMNRYFTEEYIGDESLVRDQISRLKNALKRDRELCQLTDISILLETIESI